MPALIERPKMTRTMYEALKRHIMNERAKIKQEQEQDLAQLERKLEQLRQEKHQLFLQLKKVLNQEEETRRRAQIKEQSEMLSLQQQAYSQHGLGPSGHPVMLQASHMSNRPMLYKPMIPAGMKRTRSPSPPPTSSYQAYHSDAKYAYSAAKPGPSTHLYAQHPPAADLKMGSYPQTQGAQSVYSTQASHSYVQQQQQPAVTSFQASQSAGGKYSASTQSAFSSYPGHYGGPAQAMATAGKPVAEGFPATYALQRMPQPGYHGAPHGASLQHQLEQAQKSGFAEDKYKQPPPMRGMGSSQQGALMSQALQMQQQQQSKGSIVTGMPGQPATSYQPSSTTSAYQTQQGGGGRPSYPNQPHGRYY
ncbi:hypothetical protein BaRGS_00021536 [Batillaria attramentaria]|uniref:G protein pathway suppressor 2 n=1 Tax=Batillaria attramentaria TaxID=370345 RepID=A0ABD0KJ28_9CAEN